MPVKSLLYDADGDEVADEALAVRGATVEVDEDGNVVRELDTWVVEEKALDTREGHHATRPGDVDDG